MTRPPARTADEETPLLRDHSTPTNPEKTWYQWIEEKLEDQKFIQILITTLISMLCVFLIVVFIQQDECMNVPPSWDSIRLPQWIEPYHYDLSFETSMEHLNFSGSVSIDLSLHQSADYLVLHSNLLQVQNIHLWSDNVSVQPNRIQHASEHQQLILKFSKKLIPKNYTLKMDYAGNLTDSLRGYYVSQFKNVMTGQKERLAITQFESTDARRAFPCFDEPDKKATFKITMIIPNQYHALSNMPAQTVVPVDATRSIVTFQPTVKMSTYLVAFCVTNFEFVTDKTNRGVQVSVWTPPGKTEQGRYALHVARVVLEFYEAKFGVEYPLPKSDLIAVPDFQAGAMENWGLMTFRDTALLYDTTLSSAINKQRVAEVIAHELAHQWFGDLVTMRWWNDLWLNEGFAEFMEYKGTDAVEPLWKMLDQFVYEDARKALHADASVFTHPIAATVEEPAEIQEIFDDISYSKGSSVLRMLENWLNIEGGPNYFFDGLKSYLNAHQYGNADTIDLWTALEHGQLRVTDVMNSWTRQAGFPVITVEETNTGFSLKQSRFFQAGLLKEEDWAQLFLGTNQSLQSIVDNKQEWHIPISVVTYKIINGKSVRGKPQIVYSVGKKPIELNIQANATQIVIFNAGHTGVYHVQYSVEHWNRLGDLLYQNPDILPPIERTGLLIDLFALTWAGRVPIDTLMNFIRFLEKEMDVSVWKVAVLELNSMEAALSLHTSYGVFQKYQNELMKSVANDLGWKENRPDSPYAHLRSMLRSELLSEMVAVEDKEYVKYALDTFGQIKSGRMPIESVNPEILNVIYDTGIMYGDEEDYDWMWKRYWNSTFAAEDARCLHAIASVKRPYLQQKTLLFAISGKVRRQDALRLIEMVVKLGGPTGPIMVWTFLRSHWVEAIQYWKGSDWTKFNDMIKILTSHLLDHSAIQDIERLFLQKQDPTWFCPPLIEGYVRKGLEKSKNQLLWVNGNGASLEKWLKNK